MKGLDFPDFRETVEAFDIPSSASGAIAMVVIGLELIIGFATAFGARYALTAVSTMLILFMAVAAYGLAMGHEVDCSCFGSLDLPGGTLGGVIIRNLGLLGVTFGAHHFRPIRASQESRVS
jgi:uncharacterized membrane protein YphA (DoxX/SURF4 family)